MRVPTVGAWRSLVAHLHGVQGVGGSNPLAPTNFESHAVHPYSERVFRHRALDEEGKPREILERVTYERRDGRADPVVVNRRYDLRTGESLSRLSDTEFEDCESGARLQLQP